MNTKSHKQEVREQLLAQRASLSEQEFHQKSARIIAQLKEQPVFKNAGCIHCYISLNERREVNTHPLIKDMLAGDQEVVVPITKREDHTLKNVKLNSFDDLSTNEWGVLEPSQINSEVSVDSFDLVIVPMVGGDEQKNRLGYGKGFYDRFLDQVSCPTIGLLFENCLLDEVPVEPFDVPLKMLITERRIIS